MRRTRLLTLTHTCICGTLLLAASCHEATPTPFDLAPPDQTVLDAPLALTAVTPKLGPSAGGISLTLDGAGFQGGSTVTVAGLPAQAMVASSSRLLLPLPAKPGAWGAVPVTVTNPDGQSVSRSDLFSYYASQVVFPDPLLPAATNPNSVAVGDFTGDGKPDLAVANFGSNSVSIFPGLGGGAYGSRSDFAVDASPIALAAGDFIVNSAAPYSDAPFAAPGRGAHSTQPEVTVSRGG